MGCITKRIATLLVSLVIAGIGVPSRPAAAGITVERVVVYKSRNTMQLMSGDSVVRTYRVALGRKPFGSKQRAGDCRTPEGAYVIDRHNRNSRYYRSLHISYPNGRDLAAAAEGGYSPGGDIMIHGLPREFEDLADVHYRRNWTRGCIAVNNSQMDELWRLVADGTPIVIKP